jgi:hypothetical protein
VHILDGFGMENVVAFSGHLELLTSKWYILSSFGIFFVFWNVVPRKIWNPGRDTIIWLDVRCAVLKIEKLHVLPSFHAR